MQKPIGFDPQSYFTTSTTSSGRNNIQVVVDPVMQKPSGFDPQSYFTTSSTSSGRNNIQVVVDPVVQKPSGFDPQSYFTTTTDFNPFQPFVQISDGGSGWQIQSSTSQSGDLFHQWNSSGDSSSANPAFTLFQGPEGNGFGYSKMASMTLQGFLLLSEGQPSVPFMATEISKCFQQIIWSPADQPSGLLCSRLSSTIRQDMRQVLLMVARGELPSVVNKTQLNQLMTWFQSSLNSTMTSMNMAMPMTVADISNFLAPIGDKIKNMMEGSRGDLAEESAWNFISSIFTAFTSEEGKQLLADLLAKIQGAVCS